MIDNLKSLYELSQSNLVIGQALKIEDGLTIIPVFKAKLNYFSLETSIKENGGNAGSGSMSYDPICFLQIKDGSASILPIAGAHKENVLDHIPQIMDNIDLTGFLKGIKL